jgi:S-adenosylmethionine:tRNA ribosyltransferase-isomerase
MLVSEFDYLLPQELIAQTPAARRDQSRLLVLDRATGSLIDSTFAALSEYLRTGDLLVVNNTRVFPARLIGRRSTSHDGSRVEVFLIREIEPRVWEALVKPGRSLRQGTRIDFGAGRLAAEIVERREAGRRIVRFEGEGDFDSFIDDIGRTPLPPYIKREKEDRLDGERYQTVFARERGAIAAPTAGLHFTGELMDDLRRSGVDIVEITLHVGYGTFQPVRADKVEDHLVEAERYSIEPGAAAAINTARKEGRRVIAVGTTTTRALESAAEEGIADSSWRVRPVRCEMTELFIYPGFTFRVIDALITNFHLPRSSLLMLVAAFGGRDPVLTAYRHAVENRYRFYSFGDAMLII